jgi:ribulose 1,5-bisphosphate synthetase/thiazole synthase
MKNHEGESVSVWYDLTNMPRNPDLTRNMATDVCIVGGGFGGLMSAYFLALESKRVCILESGEASWRGRSKACFR